MYQEYCVSGENKCCTIKIQMNTVLSNNYFYNDNDNNVKQ